MSGTGEPCVGDLRMVVLTSDDLERSIQFYVGTLGMKLKFRDGDRYAAIDAGSVTIALAAADDHPIPGEVVIGLKATDVDGLAASIVADGGALITVAHDDLHERRAVLRDSSGNGLVLYAPHPKEHRA